MLQMDDEDALKFYEKYKDRELLHFHEEYGDSNYIEGLEGSYFEIPNVNGSYLHDNGFATTVNIDKEKMFNEMLDVFSAYLVDIFTPQAINKCVAYMKENMQDYLKS